MHRALFFFVLCLLAVGQIADAYRPYRSHEGTSMNLAQPHRVPNGYKTDEKRELNSTQAPSPVNASIRALPESPVSSSHPSQIPSCSPNCSTVPASAQQIARGSNALDADSYTPSQSRRAVNVQVPRQANTTNTTVTPSLPPLSSRQIHNADYGSSNSASSPSDTNSTEQAHPSTSSASQPTATDTAGGNEKREEIEGNMQARRRLPRAAAMRRLDVSGSIPSSHKNNTNANSTATSSPQKRLLRTAAMRRLDLSGLFPGSNKTTSSGANSTEANSSHKRSPQTVAMRRTNILIPGSDQNSSTTTSGDNSTETNSNRRRLPRAAAMRRMDILGLTPGSSKNGTTTPGANSTEVKPEHYSSPSPIGTRGHGSPNATRSQPERRFASRFSL